MKELIPKRNFTFQSCKQCFLLFYRQILLFQPDFVSCLQMVSIWTGLNNYRLVKSKESKTVNILRISVQPLPVADTFFTHVAMSVNPFPHNDTFRSPWETSLLKTLWEKEKFLVTSNFSFSTVFSTCFDNFRPFSSNLKLSSASSFSLEESKSLSSGNGFIT